MVAKLFVEHKVSIRHILNAYDNEVGETRL